MTDQFKPIEADQPAGPLGDDAADPLLDALLLALVSGVGPRARKALIDRFGSATAALDAMPSDLAAVEGIGPKLSGRIAAARGELDAQTVVADCRARGIDILSDADPAYPPMLREIHDPPGVLFVRGQMLPDDALAIAIVGSRHATHYGLTVAEQLAGSLARAGLTIVSGLARGIDGAAHRGALGRRRADDRGAGQRPGQHLSARARRVGRPGGCPRGAGQRSAASQSAAARRVSAAQSDHHRFVAGRDRRRGLGPLGALISARHAMEQGREVFAVPGRIDSRQSQGCHRLIRDGAKLVETVDDVLEELGPLVRPIKTAAGQEIRDPAELKLNEQEAAVLACLGNEPIAIDALVGACQLSVPQVLSTLSALEMRRLVRRLEGNRVVRR